MSNPITKDRRYFEDLKVGEVIQLGERKLSKDDIISFAKQFDPLPFHLDEEVAKKNLYLAGLLQADGKPLVLACACSLMSSFLKLLAWAAWGSTTSNGSAL